MRGQPKADVGTLGGKVLCGGDSQGKGEKETAEERRAGPGITLEVGTLVQLAGCSSPGAVLCPPPPQPPAGCMAWAGQGHPHPWYHLTAPGAGRRRGCPRHARSGAHQVFWLERARGP